ncbi:MAG: VWA domain-containing protein [Planctomycetes bacterium]|nr:VWA domain-containing protein [Planctomycetota bacterium]
MGALAAVLVVVVSTAAAGDEAVAALRRALGGSDHDATAVQSAVDAAVARPAPAAVSLLWTALDRYGELLGQGEVEAARIRAALARAPADAPPEGEVAEREKRKETLERTLAGASQQQRVLDVVVSAIPALLDALAAKPESPAVPFLFEVYEESTRRVGELERLDEKQKGELAQLSSRLFTAESDAKNRPPDGASSGGAVSAVDRLAGEKAELQAKVERTELLLQLHQSARQRLVGATGAVLRGAKGSEVDTALKQIERRVDGKAAPAERALWVDLYARLGREEIPAELLGVATEMSRALKRGEGELAKLRETFEKNKELYFKATEQGQKTGTISRAVLDAFESSQRAVTEAAAAAVALERLRSACGRAVGPAVASLPEGAKRDKGVAALLTAARGERELEARVAVLEGCGAVDRTDLREALRKVLVDDREIKARLAALEALVELADRPALEIARARLLAHENWRVRAAAVSALVRVPETASVPVLIAALDVEQGRVREDIAQALQQLTGQEFAMSAPVWQQWWEGARATFAVTDAAGRRKPRIAAWERQGEGKVSFYGITSVSKRVCFVLDVSLSMKEPISPGSQRTKFDVAQEQLKQAIAALSDGDQFAVVVFAGSAARWSNKMTTVSTAVKQKVTEWIDAKIELDQGTNIHAGLKEAFGIAGMGARDAAYDSAIDTLFFLSDGDATVGEIRDPLEIRRLVREWNRLSRIRIHAIGVGEAPNVALLYGLAEDSGGQFQKR